MLLKRENKENRRVVLTIQVEQEAWEKALEEARRQAIALAVAAGAVEETVAVTIDEERIDLIRTVFWDMNTVSYYVQTIEHEDDTETILHITITSKKATEMPDIYHFSKSQREALTEVLKPEYAQMLAELVGTYGGEVSLDEAQIRAMLSGSLKGIVAQTLCKRKGRGRIAALEILVVTAAVSNLIRENKIFQIPSVIQTGHKLGMRSLNGSLLDIVQRDIVTPEEALFKSIDRNDLRKMFDENGIEYEASVTDEELM